jgi:transcriptional regulator with XRE-family HTH domain
MKKVHLKINLEPLMERKGKELGKSRLTQDDLAELSGVQQGTLSRWVNNKVDVYKRETLEKLMAIFDCGLEDLFEVTIEESDD